MSTEVLQIRRRPADNRTTRVTATLPTFIVRQFHRAALILMLQVPVSLAWMATPDMVMKVHISDPIPVCGMWHHWRDPPNLAVFVLCLPDCMPMHVEAGCGVALSRWLCFGVALYHPSECIACFVYRDMNKYK